MGLLTTAPLSPAEDDISVTASPTPSPQPPPAFPGVAPPLHGNHLFNNALAASLFLNAPLLPPPGQWLYSQFYPQELSTWMSLRHPLARSSSPQNPDSSGNMELDVDDSTSNENKPDDAKTTPAANASTNPSSKREEKPSTHEKPASHSQPSSVELVPARRSREEGVNLTIHRGRKAPLTLIKHKDEVTSSEKNSRGNNGRQVDVWRPY